MIPDGIPLKEMDMNLATCVQMVVGRMKLESHFVTNVIMVNQLGGKELPAVMNVVS